MARLAAHKYEYSPRYHAIFITLISTQHSIYAQVFKVFSFFQVFLPQVLVHFSYFHCVLHAHIISSCFISLSSKNFEKSTSPLCSFLISSVKLPSVTARLLPDESEHSEQYYRTRGTLLQPSRCQSSRLMPGRRWDTQLS
jgi:hypothetical protein